jgi:pheromone alpha factor receptor
MFMITLFMARDSHWRKMVHNFNLLSLVLGIIRAILQAIYFSSQWEGFYYFFTNDKSELTKSDYDTSVAGTVMPLVMTATINMSLALQAHTVCKIMAPKVYYTIFALSCVVLLLALGFRFAECVTNSKAIIFDTTYYSQDWITTGTLATQAISIWWFSGLFMWKLGWTIWTRWKMGWANLKMLNTLMIMGGCTMIIPCKWLPCLLRMHSADLKSHLRSPRVCPP